MKLTREMTENADPVGLFDAMIGSVGLEKTLEIYELYFVFKEAHSRKRLKIFKKGMNK